MEGRALEYSQAFRNIFGNRADNGTLFSFWTHFPYDDLDAGSLAQATIALQREYDLDFVKTSPNGMYVVEDFGLQIDFSDVLRGGVSRTSSTPFQKIGDWTALPDVDITKGAFAREIDSLRMVRSALPDIPVIFTLFSPMTIAAKLSQGRIHGQIAEGAGRETVHQLLGRLTSLMQDYGRAAIEAGADGLFFAHQDTSRGLLSHDHFSEFVVPYDIEVLAAVATARFNVLHIHGNDIRFRELQDYPVHALSWHNWETLPSMIGGALTSGKSVMGGIDRRLITANDIPALRRQIQTTLQVMEGVGDLIVTPSCTVRAGFDPATIHAMREIVRGHRPPETCKTDKLRQVLE